MDRQAAASRGAGASTRRGRLQTLTETLAARGPANLRLEEIASLAWQRRSLFISKGGDCPIS